MDDLLQSIPDYQTLMLPTLRYAGIHKQFQIQEVTEVLATEFTLSPEQRRTMLPGQSKKKAFPDRVSWAISYLKGAALINWVSRATYEITERGQKVLSEKPIRIDKSLLRRYSEFIDFEGGNKATRTSDTLKESPVIEQQLDPQAIFNHQYKFLQQKTADDLLELLKCTTPSFFEDLVEDLLIRMGYGGSGKALHQSLKKGSHDGGIDAIIQEDVLGLSSIYVQAKRWKDANISRPIVQAFAGSMDHFHANKGVFITTSNFSEAAKEFIKHIGKTIVLIDGQKLVELMFQYEVGVTVSETYKLYSIDTDYYGLEEEQVSFRM